MATDVLRLLNSVRRDYPMGVPKARCIRTAEPLLAFVSKTSLTPEERKLLGDAVTLGMKLTPTDVIICEGESSPPPTGVSILVELGGDAPGVWREEGTKRIFTSFEPSKILSDRDTKRKFWEHLKGILTILDR